MPMLYFASFHSYKYDNFPMKYCDIFLIVAQNIDYGYTLEPRGGSSEYPQSMFRAKIRKIIYTHVNPSVTM